MVYVTIDISLQNYHTDDIRSQVPHLRRIQHNNAGVFRADVTAFSRAHCVVGCGLWVREKIIRCLHCCNKIPLSSGML